ncbi:HAMP domain-containing sensor histidine kinase [Sphaerisporangium sp. TRM90804]|uniref:sensor histidine kinase n=1 Tax=Sphaerisporangium sp. TRM90804 TaxID=3031113 RepID=UPI00244CF4D5|nr:HAMP domain-containing sensor histidine kinase [Sphaerisporangium sp. TRM90804]MDH2429552.1 HAMP domain-containing sensor histidine kinase [Sphaerisporangium sp. TRM90804]
MSLRWAAAWPRSIRGQVAVLTLLLATLFLVPLGLAADMVIRNTVAHTLWQETRVAAARVVGAYRESTLRNPIAPRPGGADLIQVTGPDGRLLASTPKAERLPVLDGGKPAPNRSRDYVTCPRSPTECFHVTAIATSNAPGAPVVYAAEPTPALLTTRALDVALGLHVVALAALLGWLAWKVAHRALQTVNHIQAQLAHITVSDLSARVREPSGDNEIAHLARTVNSTLARLEHSVEQQRRFAADASHELRTPIAGLRAQLEEARLHPQHVELDTLVEGALRDTDRLEVIVTDLLFMARLGSSGPAVQESVDLADLVTAQARCCPPRVPVTTDLEEDVVVLGVRTQLARVVDNLLGNAQRHAETAITVRLRAHKGEAVLSVTNDGDRIAEEDRERVFHRFTRLDASRSRELGGTGLGLAIARDVAIAHGGTLHVEDVSEGTRFVLRLPVVE